jgi:hypothetical protein
VERFNLLSVALGLACLAGINLYLTVFATGLAIHQHWITLAPQYQSLEILGDPAIVTVAGVLFLLEFFADKIPWIDSAWDAVHTVIRPIGGALLAIQVLGHSTPTLDVLVVLLAGTTSLATHTAKATTRLISNTSPEPFSNIALSLSEDAAVLGGLALLHYHPVIAFSIFLIAIGAFLYFAPKLLRAARVKLWLIWRKLNEPASAWHRETTLPLFLPSKLAPVFAKHNVLGETIAWALPCASGRGRKIPPNLFGALVATNEEPRKLTFVALKGGKSITQTVELEGTTISREPKFLSENLVIAPQNRRGARYSFVFPRSRAMDVEKIVETLRTNLAPAREAAPVNESVGMR